MFEPPCGFLKRFSRKVLLQSSLAEFYHKVFSQSFRTGFSYKVLSQSSLTELPCKVLSRSLAQLPHCIFPPAFLAKFIRISVLPNSLAKYSHRQQMDEWNIRRFHAMLNHAMLNLLCTMYYVLCTLY